MDEAKTHDTEERTALFTTLAGHLLDDTRPVSDLDRAHLLRLLTSLLKVADKSTRRIFIEQMAQQATPPKDLAMLLAQDDADLAGPVLRNVPFTQKELIELVTRTGPEHHIEIAKRADLTLDVWLALARAAARRGHRTKDIADKKPEVRTQDIPSQHPEPSVEQLHVTGNAGIQKDAALSSRETGPVHAHNVHPAKRPFAATANVRPLTTPGSYDTEQSETFSEPDMGKGPDQIPQSSLDDTDATSWRFETTRNGRIYRLSPNAQLAFGPGVHSLIGEYFAPALQSRSAAPCADEVGGAMSRRVPLRDIIVETITSSGQPYCWSLRGKPRFSFPDGRFEGYSGVAYDLNARHNMQQAPEHAGELLNRMARAADRLAEETSLPELEDYARAMRDCVEALMSMPASIRVRGASSAVRDTD